MKTVSFHSSSFQGRRKNNEDSCIAIQLDVNNIILAVADGMGGAAAGEIASKIAVDVLKQHIAEILTEINETTDFKGILSEAYSVIQAAIRKKTEESPELKGMGTTLALLWFYKNQYVWANLGDSRIYFLNQKIIKQITKDHTYIQDFIDRHGEQVPPEIPAQYGNYITRSLDGGDDVPDVFPLNKPFETLPDDSAFLLCSDGLIPDKLGKPDEHYQSIFLGKRTLKQACEAFIKFAYDKGSTDNITVVLAEFGRVKRSLTRISKKSFRVLIFFFLGIIIVGAAGYYAVKSNLFLKSEIHQINKPAHSETGTEEELSETLEGFNHPDYYPFPPEQTLSPFSLSSPTDLIFRPYTQLHSDRVKEYVLKYQDKKKVISPKMAGNNLYISIDSSTGMKVGTFKIAINVIMKGGKEIEGKNPQTIRITP
jgi:PPM family protein phosphatase